MREDYEYEWNRYRLTTDECFYGVDSNAKPSYEINSYTWSGGKCVLTENHFEDEDLFKI